MIQKILNKKYHSEILSVKNRVMMNFVVLILAGWAKLGWTSIHRVVVVSIANGLYKWMQETNQQRTLSLKSIVLWLITLIHPLWLIHLELSLSQLLSKRRRKKLMIKAIKHLRSNKMKHKTKKVWRSNQMESSHGITRKKRKVIKVTNLWKYPHSI